MTHGNEIRTPNPNCGSCLAKRQHTEADWKEFHPGITPMMAARAMFPGLT